MLKLPKYELFKWLYDTLKSELDVQVFTDIAAPTASTWVVISQYNHVDASNKTQNAFLVSLLIEVFTKSDNGIENFTYTDEIMSILHPDRVNRLALTNFNLSVRRKPNVSTLQNENDSGYTHRALLRYEFLMEQNTNY